MELQGLISLFNKLHNILREDGITGMDAMRDICYLIGAKSIEPLLTDKVEKNKIDLLNKDNYNKQSYPYVELAPFSKWLTFGENLYTNLLNIINKIYKTHDVTSAIYRDKFLSCTRQSTLQRMIEIINKFNFDMDLDILGAGYEYFLSELTKGKTLGQYFTKREVINYMINECVVKENNISIYDPCCGTGGFLIESYKYLQDYNNIKLCGTDISQDTITLGNVNLLMNTGHLINNDDSAILDKRDSLRNQNLDKYDYILTNPPYGLKGLKMKEIKENYDINVAKTLYPINNNSSVNLYLMSLLAKMNKCLAIVLPYGSELTGNQMTIIKIRKYLLENYNLYKIVILPRNVFEYTTIQTAILFWKHGKTENINCYDYETKKDLINIPIENIIEKKYSLNYKTYLISKKICSKNNTIKQLGSICEFKNGKNITKKQLIEGGYPVIGGGIKPIGYHNQYNRNENTILVSSSGSAGYVSKYDSKIWASDCISIIPNKEILNDYLYYYLKFIQEDIYTLRTGTAQQHVYTHQLETLDIPIPNIDLQKRLIEYCNSLTIQNKYYKKIVKEVENNSKNYMFLMLNTFNKNNTIKQLGDICEILSGKNITKKQLIEGEYPVIGGGVKPMGYHNQYNVEKDVIIISRVGSAGWVSKTINKSFISDCAMYIQNIDSIVEKLYIYYYLKFVQDDICKLQTGVAQPVILKSDLKLLDIPIISVENQKIIIDDMQIREKCINDMENIIENNNNAINKMIKNTIHNT